MPSNDDIAAMVEAGAKACCYAFFATTPTETGRWYRDNGWEQIIDDMSQTNNPGRQKVAQDFYDKFTDEARRVILPALRAAQERGLKLVGREATEDMWRAGTIANSDADGTWRAMHDAAPGVGDE